METIDSRRHREHGDAEEKRNEPNKEDNTETTGLTLLGALRVSVVKYL
jgi:hypothetical protein